MTRNERIAERIKEACPCTSNRFLRGDFDDLLGPEVTSGDIALLRAATRHYFYLAENALINAKLAKAHMPYLFQKLVEDAMGFRRLAKFMRALERMAGEEGA